VQKQPPLPVIPAPPAPSQWNVLIGMQDKTLRKIYVNLAKRALGASGHSHVNIETHGTGRRLTSDLRELMDDAERADAYHTLIFVEEELVTDEFEMLMQERFARFEFVLLAMNISPAERKDRLRSGFNQIVGLPVSYDRMVRVFNTALESSFSTSMDSSRFSGTGRGGVGGDARSNDADFSVSEGAVARRRSYNSVKKAHAQEQKQQHRAAARKKQAKSDNAKATANQRTVLLVDDFDMIRQLVGDALKSMGFHVIEATDGVEAVDIFKSKKAHPEMIFMDCEMPKMDGFEATRAIRKHEEEQGGGGGDGGGGAARIPIIAMTANAMQGDRNRCAQAGMDDFLAKPLGREQLQVIMDKYLPREKEKRSGRGGGNGGGGHNKRRSSNSRSRGGSRNTSRRPSMPREPSTGELLKTGRRSSATKSPRRRLKSPRGKKSSKQIVEESSTKASSSTAPGGTPVDPGDDKKRAYRQSMGAPDVPMLPDMEEKV